MNNVEFGLTTNTRTKHIERKPLAAVYIFVLDFSLLLDLITQNSFIFSPKKLKYACVNWDSSQFLLEN